MGLTEITTIAGKLKRRKRIGRGPGSGHGKTSGRGHKGQKSRTGSPAMIFHEGGQMPLFRRLPKRGFSNFKFERRYEVVNVSQLERFDEGSTVGIEQLSDVGLIKGREAKVKILGDGELTKGLKVTAHKFSRAAEHKIVACGGEAKVV